MSLVPPVGTEGIYRLRAPFGALMRQNTSYRCDAVRRFSELFEQGSEPFEEYYRPHGLSQATYESDVSAGAYIVALVSNSGHWVYVPSTYIESYPNQGGIPYRGLVLSIPLGPVPMSMDTASVRASLQNLVRDTLGIQAQAQVVAVTEQQNLALADHNALQANREHNIRTSVTDSAKAREWEGKYRELLQRYQELERYVVSKGL